MSAFSRFTSEDINDAPDAHAYSAHSNTHTGHSRSRPSSPSSPAKAATKSTPQAHAARTGPRQTGRAASVAASARGSPPSGSGRKTRSRRRRGSTGLNVSVLSHHSWFGLWKDIRRRCRSRWRRHRCFRPCFASFWTWLEVEKIKF